MNQPLHLDKWNFGIVKDNGPTCKFYLNHHFVS
jgi:hypothetical protein